MPTTFSEHAQSPTREELLVALRDAQQQIRHLEDLLAESKWVEDALRRRTRELSERVKELDCLYKISDILVGPKRDLDQTLQSIVDTLLSGWQYPERTSALLIFRDKIYQSFGFRETKLSQTAVVYAQGEAVGKIEVFLLETSYPKGETPFLPEEESLLKAIAIWIGEIIEHRNTRLDGRQTIA